MNQNEESKPRVVINVYGGVVQDVYTDADLDVVVVDWDTEGASAGEPGIVEVTDEYGTKRLASVAAGYPPHPLDDLHPDLAAAIRNSAQSEVDP